MSDEDKRPVCNLSFGEVRSIIQSGKINDALANVLCGFCYLHNYNQKHITSHDTMTRYELDRDARLYVAEWLHASQRNTASPLYREIPHHNASLVESTRYAPITDLMFRDFSAFRAHSLMIGPTDRELAFGAGHDEGDERKRIWAHRCQESGHKAVLMLEADKDSPENYAGEDNQHLLFVAGMDITMGNYEMAIKTLRKLISTKAKWTVRIYNQLRQHEHLPKDLTRFAWLLDHYIPYHPVEGDDRECNIKVYSNQICSFLHTDMDCELIALNVELRFHALVWMALNDADLQTALRPGGPAPLLLHGPDPFRFDSARPELLT